MDFGIVTGKLWCTVKDRSLEGIKLLVLQPTDHRFRPAGPQIVAVDAAGVGEGEYVFYETAREAANAFPDRTVPADAAIIGIIDRVDAG